MKSLMALLDFFGTTEKLFMTNQAHLNAAKCL